MVELVINGLPARVESGISVLDAARFMGMPVPTLCHEDGLAPYGACRLCLVELGHSPRSRLVASCMYRVESGLHVRTDSQRVMRARRLLVELYLATCPDSKRIQDLASAWGVRRCRYAVIKHENCIQCGRCVRICREQMQGVAIGFAGRGRRRRVSRPFDLTSATCRQCGACQYICPVCMQRCQGAAAESSVCGACLNFAPVCYQTYDDAMCFLRPCHACELGGPFRADVAMNIRPAVAK
jgi:bidirectional [NiFe] hydrogenase diaphorase subunit